jgi:hypothetical protein
MNHPICNGSRIRYWITFYLDVIGKNKCPESDGVILGTGFNFAPAHGTFQDTGVQEVFSVRVKNP